MDITMPVMNGFEAVRRIKHELPSTPILMVSQVDSAPFAREAVAAGASGYVVKSNASTELIPALRKMQSQRVRTDAEIRTRVLRFSRGLQILAARASIRGRLFGRPSSNAVRPTSEPEN